MANILLIEPDRILADTFCRALEKAGHKVSVCAGAQAAVLAADRVKPDLVILELQLVEHSGIEFLYEFRSYPDWQNIPAIVFSQVPPAEFNNNHEILKNELNVTSYLYKPQTTLTQLTSVISEQLTVAA
jgi:DNA-binding response OmpR family regulator